MIEFGIGFIVCAIFLKTSSYVHYKHGFWRGQKEGYKQGILHYKEAKINFQEHPDRLVANLQLSAEVNKVEV